MDLVNKLQWTAGFLEGEGWFGTVNKKSSCVSVVAVQVQREPLERLKRYFGGYIVLRKRVCSRHNAASAWMLTGPKAAGLMMSLYSLMSPKRQQRIAECLEKWKNGVAHPRHRFCCPKGHPYSGLSNKGARICRACMTENNRRSRDRKRARLLAAKPLT